MILTAERLREVVHYDLETGVFIRLLGRYAGRPVAVRANCPHGYLQINIDRYPHLAHRLAWLYVHGVWPADRIDHRDEDRINNRFANLREATHAENLWNRGAPRNNTSGLKGVRRKRGRWTADIEAEGVRYHLGSYVTPEEAAGAYAEAAAWLHGEFARTS